MAWQRFTSNIASSHASRERSGTVSKSKSWTKSVVAVGDKNQKKRAQSEVSLFLNTHHLVDKELYMINVYGSFGA